jgi:DNA-binding MarR family transcriptional regulator
MNDRTFKELASLFFSTRQIIRQKLPSEQYADPNSWMRLEALRYIAGSDGPTMREVAGYVRIKPPSMTSLVGHLMRSGFVTKRADLADKRVVRLYPTKRGSRLLENYGKKSARTMRSVFSKLPQRDVEQLTGILRKVGEVHGA